MKKILMKEIKCTVLYCVCDNFSDSILGPVPVLEIYYGSGSVKVRNYITVPVPLRKIVTVRFRFRNTAILSFSF
jgi:hypothetical protein